VNLRADGEWIDQVSLNLVPWDAGTKDGMAFAFDFAATDPQQGIATISGMPFINTPVIANITIERVSVADIPACEAGIEPNVIELGDEAGFWWWTDGAPIVHIDNGFGQVNVADNWVWITPTETTTYTINVMSDSGERNSCSTTIVVEDNMEPSEPICEAGVEPQLIKAGDEAGFWWWTDGAPSVYIDNGFGQVDVSDNWVWVTPTETTTYHLKVKNADGAVATCSTTVTVE
jgi:membrane carboxypeptidase/penicillin-binding protein PbpC